MVLPSPIPLSRLSVTLARLGVLYELDGLQPSPIAHGAATPENWLQVATPIIQQRIERHAPLVSFALSPSLIAAPFSSHSYSASEIRFNLMALVKNRVEALNAKLAALEEQRIALEAQLAGTPSPLLLSSVHALFLSAFSSRYHMCR